MDSRPQGPGMFYARVRGGEWLLGWGGWSSPLVGCYSTPQCSMGLCPHSLGYWPALGGVGWGMALWFPGDPGAVATATWPAARGRAWRFGMGASQKAGTLVKNWPCHTL